MSIKGYLFVYVKMYKIINTYKVKGPSASMAPRAYCDKLYKIKNKTSAWHHYIMSMGRYIGIFNE